MPEFLLAAAIAVVLIAALGFVRIIRGPERADRMMAAQLLGTAAAAALLLAAYGANAPALLDVALVIGLLAGFASLAFARAVATGRGS